MFEIPYNLFEPCRIIERNASPHSSYKLPHTGRKAWVAEQGSDIVPLVGARRRDRLAEALGSLDLNLTARDMATIEAAVPKDAAAGSRYPAAAMADLDSER